MKYSEGVTTRTLAKGGLVCAGLGLLALTGCTPPESQQPSAEADVVIQPHDARVSLEGVLVAEDNPLSLYTPETSPSQSGNPTSAGTQAPGSDSAGTLRDRAVSELGLGASVDPKICEPVRDAAVSYLAVPTTSADSYKAVSRDNLTAVTVELAESAEQARERVAENIKLQGRCQDMTMSVSGVSVRTQVAPLDADVDALQSSASLVSGSVLGAPLKTVLVQASVGNAVVTVSHFDSDFLITGNDGKSRMPADELEREATSVANQVLHNLRDHAA